MSLRGYDLPDILVQIRDACGLEAALRLAHAFGGLMISIPSDPQPHHRLSQAVGHEAACAIARLVGYGKISVPLARRQRALWMLDQGASAAAAAKFSGLSERYVRRLKAGERPSFDDQRAEFRLPLQVGER